MALPLDPHLLQLYMLAVAVLILIPGPDFLLVLTRSVTDGRGAGVVATAGICVGNTIHSVLAAAGISALIAASSTLFDVLRYAGGAYLAWIGLRSLWGAWAGRGAVDAPATAIVTPAAGRARVFGQAMLTNLLNPKVILFQFAFVPQFIAPSLGHVAFQTFVLGNIISVVGGLYLIGVAALGAGAARARQPARAHGDGRRRRGAVPGLRAAPAADRPQVRLSA